MPTPLRRLRQLTMGLLRSRRRQCQRRASMPTLRPLRRRKLQRPREAPGLTVDTAPPAVHVTEGGVMPKGYYKDNASNRKLGRVGLRKPGAVTFE